MAGVLSESGKVFAAIKSGFSENGICFTVISVFIWAKHCFFGRCCFDYGALSNYLFPFMFLLLFLLDSFFFLINWCGCFFFMRNVFLLVFEVLTSCIWINFNRLVLLTAFLLKTVSQSYKWIHTQVTFLLAPPRNTHKGPHNIPENNRINIIIRSFSI